MEESQVSSTSRRLERDSLPIDAQRNAIAALLRDRPVIIVCGETGSGKTTQLPQIALAAGRGTSGAIAHTQPRRLAARAVAARIAAETGTGLGSLVGYQIRFDARAGARTRVRVMTDGILLAELSGDRALRRYDTIIIDEAHERSVNIDLLLGAVARILPRRPDLRLVITSATIDPDRFSRHFGGAPVVEVSGRTHPITIEHRAAPDGGDFDDPASPDVVVPAVLECLAREPSGDVLVFLPGEREIAECADALEPEARRRGVEVLRLSARLPAEAQDRILRPEGARRVVLSTNVAETSLTVPRVRAVVDSGVARLRRYSTRARVERLLVEPISLASAAQRAGRCGRVGPGLCLRLFPETSDPERPAQTTPEILRSNLAGVVLRMKASDLGEPADFPFIDPPAPRLWQDGVDTLVELGAIDRRGRLSEVGRRMADLPTDPRTSRMLLAALETDCLAEVLPIAAALSVQDPIASPIGDAGRATLARSMHPDSDFLGLLQLWREIVAARATRGSSALARWCREQGLSPRRVREWIDVHDQLRRLAVERWRGMAERRSHPRGDRHGRRSPDPRVDARVDPRVLARVDPRDAGSDRAREGAIHRAILTGFATQIGRRQDDGTYAGVSGPPFVIHRESVLARRSPAWIVAAEIVDTGRRTARLVARIQGDWVERVAPHLLRRQHSEPHFVPESGHVAAWEKVSFGALVLVPRRRVPYEPIDPKGARDVFIHAALVDEQLRSDAPFLERNRALRERLEVAERKRRERGLLVDVEARSAFYDARVPLSVVNAASFETWRRGAEAANPNVLIMREQDLLRRPVDLSQFPDSIDSRAGALPLRYDHTPGAEGDGVTMRVPLAHLSTIDAEGAEWIVPGMLEGKVEALIRALPKRLRTRFTPAREVARGAVEHLGLGGAGGAGGHRGSLRRALAAYLRELGGIAVDAGDFDLSALPAEFLMRFEVVDERGEVLDAGRDLPVLQRRWAARAEETFRASVRAAASAWEVTGRTNWDFAALPWRVEVGRDSSAAYPAVVDEGASVGVRLLATEGAARESMRLGLRRLALFELGGPIAHHVSYHPDWPELRALAARAAPDTAIEALLAPAIVEHAALADPLPRSAEEFEARLAEAAPKLHACTDRVVSLILRLLRASVALDDELAGAMPAEWVEAAESIRAHRVGSGVIDVLGAPGDLLALRVDAIEADLARWRRLPRGGVERDRAAAAALAPWAHRAAAALGSHPIESLRHAEALHFWSEVERLRIRLFGSGAAIPRALEDRLEAAWSRLS